jgi:outer membrane immunogenic protein
MRIKSVVLLSAVVLFTLPVLAQDSGRSDVSVNFTGNFQSQATGLGVTDTATYSGGFLANYRYHFNDWGGFEFNYAYTRFSQNYSPIASTVISSTTQANADEFTLAFVSTLGVHNTARIRPFVEVGTGALIFSPIAKGSTVSGFSDDRGAFVFGAGADWRVSRQVSLRLGYRDLIYKAADFGIPTQLTNAVTNMSEPYVGLVLHF